MSLPPNFSFVIENKLAGSAHPGLGGDLVDSLSTLRGRGVGGILSLTEEPLDFAPIREFEFDYLHLPIADFTAPTDQQVDDGVRFISEQLDNGHGVLVHCQAGYGRTGTLLACFLVAQGVEPAEAIVRVRRTRPGSLEVYSQEYAVYQFAKRLKGRMQQAEEG